MRMMNMRIEDLKIFVDVVRYHSMNIAAENNFTTPQNLSKIIKRMEDELGVVLFNRSKRGSELTKEGERFYLQVVEVLKLYDNAIMAINRKEFDSECEGSNKNNTRINQVKVMCTQGVLSYAVMEAYSCMEKLGIRFVLEEDEINFYDSLKIKEYIEGKSCDLLACIIKKDEVDEFIENMYEYIPMHVFLDEMVLVISKNNFMSKRSVISIEELKDLNFISFKDNVVYSNEIENIFSYQILTNSVSKALELIRDSDSYCTILGRSFTRLDRKKFGNMSNLRMIRLKEKLYCTFVILLNKKYVDDEIMLAFVKKISEVFFEEENGTDI